MKASLSFGRGKDRSWPDEHYAPPPASSPGIKWLNFELIAPRHPSSQSAPNSIRMGINVPLRRIAKRFGDETFSNSPCNSLGDQFHLYVPRGSTIRI
jgi:hypothetical protein